VGWAAGPPYRGPLARLPETTLALVPTKNRENVDP
jgi:hypothetical protein